MTERNVSIYVTKELRSVIHTLKHELTYDQFLSELIKKNPESPRTQVMMKASPKTQTKGAKLN
jgi:hypothetical protein